MSCLRVWLDDLRPCPAHFDIHVRDASSAIELLKAGNVACISLDHDLGLDAGDGYKVAAFIEQEAYNWYRGSGGLPRLEVLIHTANPVGRRNMEVALARARGYWDEAEETGRG